MQDQNFEIVRFSSQLEGEFWRLIEAFGFEVMYGEHYQRCLERHYEGEITIFLGFCDGGVAGFCLLNRVPKYALFKKMGIPEIQDLNVLPSFRKRGIGGALIHKCEVAAADEGHKELGIGVGLDQSFGAAQRLYVRNGYIPDGMGVTYDRAQVAAGEFRPIDENLSLMMVKTLKS